MHLRLSYFIALTAALVLVAASPSSAQTFQEWQFVGTGDGSVCSTTDAVSDDNIVWGTALDQPSCTDAADDDNIVWGTMLDEDNIVWGTRDDEDNIVWGTAADEDNIVWGTREDDDNIVWGTQLLTSQDVFAF